MLVSSSGLSAELHTWLQPAPLLAAGFCRGGPPHSQPPRPAPANPYLVARVSVMWYPAALCPWLAGALASWRQLPLLLHFRLLLLAARSSCFWQARAPFNCTRTWQSLGADKAGAMGSRNYLIRVLQATRLIACYGFKPYKSPLSRRKMKVSLSWIAKMYLVYSVLSGCSKCSDTQRLGGRRDDA